MEITLHRLNEGGTFENEFLVLTIQKSYTAGRKSDNDFVFKSKGISRKHCIFHHKPDGLFVEVLKHEQALQVNGVNQIKGTVVPLKNGDIVEIGKSHTYKVQIEPLAPDITNENQPFSDFLGSRPGNAVVKTESFDTDLSETLPNNIRIKSELEIPEFLEDTILNVSCSAEEVDPNLSENRISHMTFGSDNVNIPLPSVNIIKSEPDENLLNSESAQALQLELPTGIAINLEENADLTYHLMEMGSLPQISDLDGAMQISIEEHDTKPLILPLINPETSTSISEISTPTMQPENQTPPATIIKREPVLPNEVISQNSIIDSDLNQNVLQTRIKIENPDIPFTNITLFATPEERIPEIVSNHDVISEKSELPTREKTPKILVNPNVLPEEADSPSRARTPDLEEEMQIDVEEPDIKPFPFLTETINSSLQPEIQNAPETVESDTPVLRIRNDLGLGLKIEPDPVEPSIDNQFSIESSIEPSNPDQNLSVTIKEERIDPSETPNAAQIDGTDSRVIIKEERVDHDTPIETEIEQTSGIRIKEEILDPPESPEVEFIEEKRKRSRRDSDDNNLFGVRIKQEKIDPPESVQSELDLLDASIVTRPIKREKPDPPELAVQNRSVPDAEDNIQSQRIKPEPDSPDSPECETFREEPAREKEISDPIDYSELVNDEIDIQDEKPGPSLMERLSQFEMYSESLIKKRLKEEVVESLPSAKRFKRGSSGSDSDSSSDSSDSDSDSLNKKGCENSVAVKVEDEEEDSESLTPAQREEYKRYLLISEILDSNKDPEVVDRLIKELDRKLEEEKTREKGHKGIVEYREISDDEVEIIRDDRSRRHKKRKKRDGRRESSKRKSRRSDRKSERRSDGSRNEKKKKKRKRDEGESKIKQETLRERRHSRKESLSEREKEDGVNRKNGYLGRESRRRRESPITEAPRRESPKGSQSLRGSESPRRREVAKERSSLKRRDSPRRREKSPSTEIYNFRQSPNRDLARDSRREKSPDPSPRSPEPFEYSKDSQVHEPKNENRNLRTDPMDRNYPGARVLDDYDLPEERGRSDPRDRTKYGARTEKKKLDYKEYLKRRAMAKDSSGGAGEATRDLGARPKGSEASGIAPISTFRDSYVPQPLMDLEFRVPNAGVPVPGYRAQPQSSVIAPSVDPRFMPRGVEQPVPLPFMDPRTQSRPQVPPYRIPGVPPAFDPRYQGRADLHSPIEGPRDHRFMYGGLENHGVAPAFDPRYQGRADLHSLIEGPRDPRYMYAGMENQGVAPANFDPRLPGRADLQSPIGEVASRDQRVASRGVETSGEGSRDHRSRARGMTEDEIQMTLMNQRSGARILEPPASTSNQELVANPISKLKMKNGKDGKSEDWLTQKVCQLNVTEDIKPVVRTKPLESKELSDELLVTIFSWHPELFEAGLLRNSPIPSLRNVGKTSLSYESYDSYCATVFPLLLLDVSCQIQDAFNAGMERPSLQDCRLLPSTIPKVKIPARKTFLVPLLLKSSVSILDDSKPPSEGDLLRFYLVNEYKKSVVMFGYIQKVVNEETMDLPRRLFTFLVSISEQEFDIHRSTIQDIKPIVNLKSSIEKAKALFRLRRSELLPCILHPNSQINPALPVKILDREDLVSKDHLDKMQFTAVSKIIKAFNSELPNICLVEGSAGTGKTNIIVNTILQLLCTQKFNVEKERLRILVSASTNVEMDEIIIKLKSALELANIEKDVVKMVLVGPDEGRRERTKELNLSNFARNHVESDIHRYQVTMGLKSMEEQAAFLTEQMNILTKKFEMTKCVHVALQMSLIKMYYDIGRSGRKVKEMTAQEKRELLEVAEKTFLAGANLIFCSIPNLGCSVMENLSEKHTVGVCIVDEAAQILELDTLKVLPFKEKTLVLLGDICKNPTNHDNMPRLRNTGYGCSLFSRIENSYGPNEKSPVLRLITQYRISTPIEEWLINSRIFGMNSLRNLVHQNVQFPLHSLRIFNLSYTEDFVDNEAVFASRLIHCIVSFGDLRRMERNISMGVVISDIDAKERVEQEIKNTMEEIVPGKAQIFNIEVDTIDGFFNHEKDIILASCIRNRHLTSRAGFQRFYCTLTRAKHCLIVYGRFAKISKFKQPCEWHQLIDFTRNVVSVSAYAESTELRRDLIR
ncbi:uncharacterized protein LOC117168777 isoform X2 [Belonocnema kinseyi]|nr:uncharacterized protein LOC117168777 isoform X2 [Belonocnema kinseyi]